MSGEKDQRYLDNDKESAVVQVDTNSTLDEVQKVFSGQRTTEEINSEVDNLISTYNLEEYRDLLTRGALLANDPESLQSDIYTESEKEKISKEIAKPFASLSRGMIWAALCTSFAAVNFGMDESAVGGAVLGYQKAFNITNPNIQGMTLAAPYLAAGVLTLPLTVLLNKRFGRRFIIFVSCFIGFSGSLIQAFSNGFACLLFARIYLGIGMGLCSSTVPIYTAECAPAVSRGALLMLWQTFIALGVCLGSVFNRAFVNIPGNLSWRLMIGSSCVAPLITLFVIYVPPESPRWLIANGDIEQALKSLMRLRNTDVGGARDFYILYESLIYEKELAPKLSWSEEIVALFSRRRNRFALWVSFIGILGQQYGGVNILVSYTATILTSAGIDPVTAIAGSIGIGGGCFLATLISSQLIDRYGRRRMLLLTIPVEGICLFWLGGVLNVTDNSSRLAAGLTAMYVFVLFYGTGIGPISFTLVAETPSITVRMAHSAFSMSINWLLDFCLTMTWPKMSKSMTASGGLYFYGGFNFLIWTLVLFCVPETKKFTLEELDEVFEHGVSHFAKGRINKILRKSS